MGNKELKAKKKRKPTFIEAISIVVILLTFVVVGVYKEVNTVPMIIIATMWALFIGWRCGYTYKELWDGMLETVTGVNEVVFIILSIGIFIASMVFSGTIPTIIYYLIGIISPNLMIVLSFLLTGIVAFLIGTSWGTAGTVGIILLSIASSMDVSMPMVAGAVISGSHVGQLLSPMSDTTNIAAGLAKTDVVSIIKRICYYSIPVVIIAIVAYTLLGFTVGSGTVDTEKIVLIKKDISSVFNVNPIVILPMVLVFVLTFKKQPIVKSLLLSSLLAVIFGAVFNKFSIWKGLDALYVGFDFASVTGLEEKAFSDIFITLVNRGGILGMIGPALLAMVATCFGGIMIKIDAVKVIAETVFGKVKNRVALVISSVLLSGIVVALTTNAYLAILIATELFREKFYQAGMDDEDLISSCICASSQFVTVIPWVDTAIYLAAISGVSTMTSLPFNIFCWGNAVMAIILSIFGIGFSNGKRNIFSKKKQKRVA